MVCYESIAYRLYAAVVAIMHEHERYVLHAAVRHAHKLQRGLHGGVRGLLLRALEG